MGITSIKRTMERGATAPAGVIVLGARGVAAHLLGALHDIGMVAAWAVNERQAAQLLGALPGSQVVLTDDTATPHGVGIDGIIDVRGVASSTDDAWASTVAPLIVMSMSMTSVPHATCTASRSDLMVDDGHWQVLYRDRPLQLTDAQYQLLSRLVHGGDRLVTLRELARGMFDSEHCERERIHAHVKRLRVRLAAETDGRYSIVAIRGLGYRLADNGELSPATQTS